MERRIWITSDTHFNHVDQMRQLCNRPYDYEERIIKAWDRLIKPEDILIHLGDICIGNDLEVHQYFIAGRNIGQKILVKGNHDRKSDNWYMTHGWDFVCDALKLRRMGLHVLLTHIPQPKQNGVDINVHGHLHNKAHRVAPQDGAKRALYSQELHNYQPMLLDTLIKEAL